MPADAKPALPAATPPAPPVPHVPQRADPVEIKTRVELVRMAFRELRGVTYASTGAAIVFAIAAAQTSSSLPMIGGWLAFVLGLGAYRLWLDQGFRVAQPGPDDSPKWAFRFVAAATLSGFAWGVTAWMFPFLERDSPYSIPHTLLLAGLSTGSSRILLPMRKGSIAYLAVIAFPM
eukprot:gene381-481_t